MGKENTSDAKKCLYCGVTFQRKRGERSAFHSEECRKKRDRENRNKRRGKSYQDARQCKICGVTFLKSQTTRTAYCSDDCAAEALQRQSEKAVKDWRERQAKVVPPSNPLNRWTCPHCLRTLMYSRHQKHAIKVDGKDTVACPTCVRYLSSKGRVRPCD